MGSIIRSYRDLDVWREAKALVHDVYRLTRRHPREELFGLTGQIRRAAISVPANIAEGYGRDHLGDYLHHLSIGKGSTAETETLLLIGRDEAYAADVDYAPLLDRISHVGRMLTRLRDSLRQYR